MSISIWFQPAWDYANTAGNANGQALFSCEYVRALIERTSAAENLLSRLLAENDETRCGIRKHLVDEVINHREKYGL